MTVWAAETVFPFTSVTVHVTVVDPTGKIAGALFVTDAMPQLSAKIGEPSTTPDAEHKPKSAAAVTLDGGVTVGNWLSKTVTV